MEKVLSMATIIDVDPQSYFAEKDMDAMVKQMQDTAEATSSSKAEPVKKASKTAKPKAEGKAKEAKTSTKAKKTEDAEEKPKKKSSNSKSAGE